MFNSAPINDKLLIAAGVTLTCTVIIGVWSVFQFEKLYIDIRKFNTNGLPSIHAAHNLRSALTSLHTTLCTLAFMSDQDSSASHKPAQTKNPGESSLELFSAAEQEYKRLKLSSREREVFRQFDSTMKQYLTLYNHSFALPRSTNVITSSRRNISEKNVDFSINNSDSITTLLASAHQVYYSALTLSKALIEENTRHTNSIANETLHKFLFSRLFVTMSLVIAIFISLGVNWFIARSIVRRLRIIQIAAERIAYGNLHVRIAMTEPDEIGRLARAFNRMTETLKDTLNNLAEERVRERQAQLEALQAQLAPHFLFNCLTALGGLIMVNKEQAIEFLEKLSYTYRYVLTHRQQHLVTLEEELNFVNAYTFLASIRFKDGFNVDTNVPNEYRHHTLPSMALQLLLENAVKHNIVSAEQPLRISLEIVSIIHPTNAQATPHLVVRNNIQRRSLSINSLAILSGAPQQTSLVESTNLGLQNLQNRYKLLSELVPNIMESETEFIVMLPLVK